MHAIAAIIFHFIPKPYRWFLAIFLISGSEVLKSGNMVIILWGYDYQYQGLLEEWDCSSTMKTVTYQKQKEITTSVAESHKAHWRKVTKYPFGPASPSPATLRILPLLTPGGILTLISLLTRIRPSPEHFRQYSEITSPTPPQFGQTETWSHKNDKKSKE